MLKRFATLAFSVSTLSFASLAHAAVDAQKVADAIKAFGTNNSMTIGIASAESAGENIVLKGLTFTPAPADAKPIDLGDVTLENVTEGSNEFVAGQITIAARDFDDGKGTKASFAGAVIKNMHIPKGDDVNNPLGSMLLADSYESGAVTVSYNGAPVFKMDGAAAHYSAYVEGQPLTFDASFNGLHGDFSAIPDEKAKQTFADLGISQIDGKITAKGSWNMSDGRIGLTEYAFDFANIGKLNFLVDLSGYTPAFIKQMQAMTKELASKKDDPAQSMALLGLVQQLTFNSLSIRFDDASITNKIIDYAAKQAGQPRDAVLAQAKGVIPFAMMQLQDAEFSSAVTAAVTAFLDNPKSLEIKAAPAQGVPFSMLAATGMSQPAALIKQLGLTVTANK